MISNRLGLSLKIHCKEKKQSRTTAQCILNNRIITDLDEIANNNNNNNNNFLFQTFVHIHNKNIIIRNTYIQ